MTTTMRIEGVATLLSSLSHGGEHAGTVQYLRRERVVQADGTTREVPVVSGNALRGVLRRHAAQRLWEMLGRPTLPLPTLDALFSGGALAKAGAGNSLTPRQLAQLRDLVPMVSLFGCAGGGRIIEGRLLVGKLTPVCAETAHLMPPGVAPADPQSVWGMLQVEEFSRSDDARRLTPAYAALAAPQARPAPELPQASMLATTADDEADAGLLARDTAQQMRYGVETLAAGTRLHWWLAVRNATDLEVDCLRDTLAAWAATGAHLGGRSATGHGRLQLDVAQWVTTGPQVTAGAPLPARSDDLARYTEAHRAEALEALSWLN